MELCALLYHMERRTGALINIDATHPAFYAPGVLGLAPEQRMHRGAFCEFAKRYSLGTDLSCHNNKQRRRKTASRGDAFSSTCPYGIWEWIQPVMVNGEHVATVYLGYFATEDLQTKMGEGQDVQSTANRKTPGGSLYLSGV